MVAEPDCTVFVCVSCQVADPTAPEGETRPGRALHDALAAGPAIPGIRVAPVDCLAVCKRPCTVALTGPGRWVYVVGDLDAAIDPQDVRDFATAYAATKNGIVAWRDRPKTFRKGVIARTPPSDFRQPEAAE